MQAALLISGDDKPALSALLPALPPATRKRPHLQAPSSASTQARRALSAAWLPRSSASSALAACAGVSGVQAVQQVC